MVLMKLKQHQEHPFYVMTKDKTNYSEPYWKKVKDLDKNDYIGVAINNKNEQPIWNGIEHAKGHKKYIVNTLTENFNKENFWWVIGRYFGDGWIRIHTDKKNVKHYRIIICCNKKNNEKEDILNKLEGLYHASISDERTTYKLHICNKELTMYLEQFGHGAKNKKLSSDILNLPINLLKSFLEGYFSADGYTQS